MCGLLAIFSPEEPIDDRAIERAWPTMRRRGPDGDGLFRTTDRRVALVHSRLAIVDRAGGAQPIENEDGSIVAIVNGELYGDDEIRRRLESEGHHFRSRSDSEILVHLYERDGLGALEHLRGEFAFVLWDARRQRLVCARDRFGVRPLFFARHRGALFVASEAKTLIAAGVPASWDHEALRFAFTLQYPLPNRTLFAGIEPLRAGHVMVADRSSQRLTRYWDLDLPRERPDDRSAEAWAETLRASLDEAVRVRLRADVEVAAQLSGGIDSSSVVALAMRHRTTPLPCFTIAFDAPEYDERALAAETSAACGATLHTIAVGADDLVEHLPDAVLAGEGLALNGHLVGKYLLARAVRAAGYSVVLTGEGADEVLTGYAHLRADLQPDARLAESNLASAGIMLPSGEALPLDGVARVLGFVPTFLAAKATLGHRLHALLDEDFRASMAGRDLFVEAVEDAPRDQREGRHPVDVSTLLWSRLALTGYILRTLGDGVEMAHGVESRLPFLDHRFVDTAKAVPLGRRVVDGVEKHPLRLAMRGLVPDRIIDRQKHPFLAPPLSRFGETLLQDSLRGRSLAPFLDRSAVLALLDRLRTCDARERTAIDPALMMVLTATILGDRLGLHS